MPRLHLWDSLTKPPDVQIWKSKHGAEWHSITTYCLSSISVKLDWETVLAHLSSPSVSDTPLFLTSLQCSLPALWSGTPLENSGAFPPSVTSQPSLKHLVHHSYTYTTCGMKQATWTTYKRAPLCLHVSPWLHGSLGTLQAHGALVNPTTK